ncbi:MAG: nitrilase-related carbon-nitrogen hydrolase [Acidobacteriaceae bacterium]
MASANNYSRYAMAFATIVVSATLFWFGNGLNPIWPLMWIAPLPVLVFASKNSSRATAFTAFLAVWLGSLNLWHYLRVLGAPPTAWLVIFTIAALAFMLAVLLFRALLLRGAAWSALVALPAAWVVYEYLRNITSSGGTAGSFAYSQLSFLPFLQLASLAGTWGMTFFLLLFSTALAIGWHLRSTSPKKAAKVLIVGVGSVVLVLVFGMARLAMPLRASQVRVGLIASDKRRNVYVADPGASTQRLFGDYAAAAETLTNRGAQVIVMPEKLGTVEGRAITSTDAIFQTLADKTGATIVAGMVDLAAPVQYNQARVYAPGRPISLYDKRHMLPPMESKFTPGTTLTVLARPSGIWGVAICKDMDFSAPSRLYGEAGVGLLLVPGWDFNIDRGWHGHIAIMRGVESGFSIAHAAKNGYLTVTDNRGRILAQTRSDSEPFATLIANVPVAHARTLYLLWGDWFAWLSLAILVLVLIKLFRLRTISDR